MQELELTWGRTASVWWLVVWRGAIGGAILGSIAGGIGGLIAAMMTFYIVGHGDVALGQRAGRIGGVIASILVWVPWGLVVLRMAVKKKYSGFRLAMIPTSTT
ncbi:MAG TPA: hypothetical protein VMV19_20925 [Xanthobacteraceae bacterium]|nr:hypothetical protein [Xanthobacteraceae bacterium]